jgi:hypothetical protein
MQVSFFYYQHVVCPYLAFDAMAKLKREGLMKDDISVEKVSA